MTVSVANSFSIGFLSVDKCVKFISYAGFLFAFTSALKTIYAISILATFPLFAFISACNLRFLAASASNSYNILITKLYLPNGII